jgi:hypothetical protein
MKKTFNMYFLLATVTGLAIAWMDSQINWDDTGITAFVISLAATLFGFLAYEKLWLIALAVSMWIPLWAIFFTHNYGGLLALLPGFAGAYAGYFIKYMISKNDTP